MIELIGNVFQNTLKYLVVLIIGLAAGYFIIPVIHAMIDEKSLRQSWHELNERKIGEKVIGFKDIAAIFITSLTFILLFIKYGMTAEFVFFSYLMLILIIMFFVDIETKTIPNTLVLAGLAGSSAVFLYNIFIPLKIYENGKWWQPLLGILPGSGLLLIIAVVGLVVYKNDEVMGMGDVKIFAPIGIFLGWKMCVLSLIISIFIGGITSLLLIILKIKGRKDTIPFGPFIAVASFITIMWGQEIWMWYFSML